MRRLALLALFALAATSRAADRPPVDAYLAAGQTGRAEVALENWLADRPRDDDARFALGFVRVVRAAERAAQSAYAAGPKTGTRSLMPRLPVPENPDPAPVTYGLVRLGLDTLYRDLAAAEATLAGVTDDKVSLRVKLGDIRIDLDGDGRAGDRSADVLRSLMGNNRPEFLKDNESFEVRFDRGDVAWLRAYCHLVMGVLDIVLAVDLREDFDRTAADQFRRVHSSVRPGKPSDFSRLTFREPNRLGRFRRHLVRVTELNAETWRHVRAETDDDREWLPHPKQNNGVLGLRTRDEQIDNWLGAMAELKRLLEGERVLPRWLPNMSRDRKGLSARALLDDPGEEWRLTELTGDLPERWFVEKPEVDAEAITRAIQMMLEPGGMGYAAWFN